MVARIIGLFTAAIGSCVCYLLLPSMTIATYIIQSLMIGILLGAFILTGILFLPNRLPKVQQKTIKSMLDASRNMANISIADYSKAFIWSMLGHVIAFGGVFYSLDAIGETPPRLGTLFSYLTSTCCGVIAFLFPGSQITWDAIFTSLLVISTKYTIVQASIGVAFLRVEQISLMIFGALPLVWLMKDYLQSSRPSSDTNTL